MKCCKILGFFLTATLSVPSSLPVKANPPELYNKNNYVIMTTDADSLQEIVDGKGVTSLDVFSDDSLLEDANMALLRMTPQKAKALSMKDDVICIEEDIIFYGQGNLGTSYYDLYEMKNEEVETDYTVFEESSKEDSDFDETVEKIDESFNESTSWDQETSIVYEETGSLNDDISESVTLSDPSDDIQEETIESELHMEPSSEESTESIITDESSAIEDNTSITDESSFSEETEHIRTPDEIAAYEEAKAFFDAVDCAGNDLRSKQWNMEAIHWNNNLSMGAPVKVAILDSGVNYDDDISIAENICVLSEDKETNPLWQDVSGHGTGMASLITAADNKIGISGIYPQAQLYSIKVLDDNNKGSLANVISGIHIAIDRGCKIINMSFGTNRDSLILHEAIQEAYAAGILLIAAAGNQNGPVMYPAAYPEVIAVGATDSHGKRMQHMADGDEIEILAPGDKIPISSMFNGGIVADGTSVSAAQVSGGAALLWAKHPARSADYIRKLLAHSAQKVDNREGSPGLLDIANSIQQEGYFSAIYRPNISEYPQMDHHVRSAGKYDTAELVNGQWLSDGHEALANYLKNSHSINNNYFKLMRRVSVWADKKNQPNNEYNFGTVKMLHAGRNYVVSMDFLLRCAKMLEKKGTQIVPKATYENIIKTASTESGLEDSSKTDAAEGKVLKQYTIYLLKNSMFDNMNENTGLEMCYKILGFALHLAGDLNAHRTMVPYSELSRHIFDDYKNVYFKSTPNHKPSDHGKTDGGKKKLKQWAKYAKTSDICHEWVCFKKAVEFGFVEYRDIGSFGKPSSEIGDDFSWGEKYEDNVDCYSIRYDNSKVLIKRIFTYVLGNSVSPGTPTASGPVYNNIIAMLVPISNSLKFNAYKLYSQQADLEHYNYYDNSFWDAVSTPEEY